MSRILAITLNPAIDISCDADRILPTIKIRTTNQILSPGGGGTNVARVVAALGGVADLAYLSGGPTGEIYDAMLSNMDLRLHRFPMKGDVRVAYMVHGEGKNAEYRFVPDGPEVSDDEIDEVVRFVLNGGFDFVVASGSLPRGASVETYARLAKAANKAGARFALDTSGPPLRQIMETTPIHLLKANITELDAIAGRGPGERMAAEIARELVSQGRAKLVAVSMGSEGAVLISAGGCMRASPIPVTAVSTVGAGDSFMGAMIWALSERMEIQQAFRYAVAAGTAAVMTPGTELCHKVDVEALLGKVSLSDC